MSSSAHPVVDIRYLSQDGVSTLHWKVAEGKAWARELELCSCEVCNPLSWLAGWVLMAIHDSARFLSLHFLATCTKSSYSLACGHSSGGSLSPSVPGDFPCQAHTAYSIQWDLQRPWVCYDGVKLYPLLARWLMVLWRQSGGNLEKLRFSLRCHELAQCDMSIVGMWWVVLTPISTNEKVACQMQRHALSSYPPCTAEMKL